MKQDFSKFTLLTSNLNKLGEYHRYGLNIKAERGKDIPEVLGNIDEVILYKSLYSGVNTIVEDTVLEIDGVEVVDIRWKINQLTECKSANWIVSLGLNDGECIKVYRAKVKGRLINSSIKDGFGFDEYFIPDGLTVTLGELDRSGNKDLLSARKLACDKLLQNDYISSVKINDIINWTGSYQHQNN